MDVSVFRAVAIGMVAENKDLMDAQGKLNKEIAWFPVEWAPMRDGEIASNPVKTTFQATDLDGTAIADGIISDNIMRAFWIPGGSNRLSPPDVRRGMRVKIFQVADDDKYYWQDMGLDGHLMKLETVIVGISATRDESQTTLNTENMYWLELSSHSKKFAFSSSKADGEPFKYEMFFDFAKGEFTVTDDIGNFLNLVSKESLIHLQNDKGSFVKVDKKDIKINAPQDILADAARDVNVTAGRNMSLKAGNRVTINGGGSIQEMTAGGTTLKTPQYDITT